MTDPVSSRRPSRARPASWALAIGCTRITIRGPRSSARPARNCWPTCGLTDPLLDIARHLEEAALKDSYFLERKLYPNVDFYSGIMMRAIGIPINMFTVMFSIGRMPGWIANWHEVAADQKGRIYRPRQIYDGPVARDYLDKDQRGYAPLKKDKQ